MPEPTETAPAGAGLADDPRVLQVLNAEHASLASARALAYNEAFTRAGMFLTALSASFVGLALLAQVLPPLERDFLLIVAIVIGFDFIIGVVTYIRLDGIAWDDMRAIQGMNRIRHAYILSVPASEPFFVTGTHDDFPGVMRTYGFTQPSKGARTDLVEDVIYGLASSAGLVGIVMSLVGGVEAGVIALLVGLPGWAVLLVAAIGTVVIFALAGRWVYSRVAYAQTKLDVRFPSPVPRDDSSDGTG